jgi:hypothetical protein
MLLPQLSKKALRNPLCLSFGKGIDFYFPLWKRKRLSHPPLEKEATFIPTLLKERTFASPFIKGGLRGILSASLKHCTLL